APATTPMHPASIISMIWVKPITIPFCMSVRSCRHLMIPCPAGGSVDGLDIAQPPLDLSGRVRGPVRAGRGHLRAGQRLRDAVRTGIRVSRLVIPAAFPGPEAVQAAELTGGPAERAQEGYGVLLRAACRLYRGGGLYGSWRSRGLGGLHIGVVVAGDVQPLWRARVRKLGAVLTGRDVHGRPGGDDSACGRE